MLNKDISTGNAFNETVPLKSRTWVVNQRPYGQPILSGENATFRIIEEDLPALKDNQILVKVEYVANAPSQREWIEPTFDPSKLYRAPILEGQKMDGRGLGRVVRSTSKSFTRGQWVKALLGWSEYVIFDESDPNIVDAPELPGGLSRTQYLGVFGNTGLSAYFGYVEVGQAKEGETVLVSAAAGSTGSMVVQIAKHLVKAGRIIGIAGTDEKCRWVESLGADRCVNYKSSTFKSDLIEATRGGVDLYYDNVGGEILDEALLRMNRKGKIVACGAISGNNSGNIWTSRNYYQIILMSLTLRGFILDDYLHQAKEATAKLRQAIQDGLLVVSDANETIIDTKFEDIPRTWLKLFEGVNTGKLITKLV